jgi:hypothetical protein
MFQVRQYAVKQLIVSKQVAGPNWRSDAMRLVKGA